MRFEWRFKKGGLRSAIQWIKKIALWYETLFWFCFIIELWIFVLRNLNWLSLLRNPSLQYVLFNELANYFFENDIFVTNLQFDYYYTNIKQSQYSNRLKVNVIVLNILRLFKIQKELEFCITSKFCLMK